MHGAARITATGLEALLAQANGDPHLAPLAGGLAVAIQLAKREGDELVWNVAFTDSRLTVNGMDPTQPPGGEQSRGQQQPGRQPGRRR